MFNRIRLNLTLWYMGVLLAIVAVIGGVTYTILYQSLSSEVDDSLESSARQIAAQISEESLSRLQAGPTGNGGNDHDGVEEEEDEGGGLRFFGATSGDTFYLVLDPRGELVLNPLNVKVTGVPDAHSAAVAAAKGEDWRTLTSDGWDYRLYSRAVIDEGRPLAIVQVGRSLKQHQERLQRLLMVLIGTGAAGLALAAAGGLFLAGRALGPVREAFQRQRAFVADASHELRTPLTLLRGNAEMLQMGASGLSPAEDKSVKEIIRQTQQIERLIADMSTLARLDEGRLVLEPGPVDLSMLLETTAADARMLAQNKGIRVRVEVEDGVTAVADEARLQELLLALVDNAVRHTPEGGEITLRGAGAGDYLEIAVTDTGPGIPPEHLGRIFERFYRVDPSRSREEGGSGLGLSIARAIAEAHGGTITAANRAAGGAVFTVRILGAGPPRVR